MNTLILAINTAQPIHELALLDEEKSGISLLKEDRWQDAKQDLEQLPLRLRELLEAVGREKQEIKKIMVVKGPGSFTSLRTGVAFANALAEGLSAELFELDSFQCLARKIATANPLLVLFPAGGLDAGLYINGELKIGPLADLLAKHPHNPSYKIAHELGETLCKELHSIANEKGWHILEAHEYQTLGESIETLGLKDCKQVELTQPLYLKSPKITLSQDPWKQPRA